ncbi:MAG: CBS domain-containing protein [Cyanobacteria bacterium P01_G01_bin.39]
MKSNESLFALPDIESAIARSPLIIAPDTLLTDAIALMGQTQGFSCKISDDNNAEFQVASNSRFSCALIIIEGELQGILTERDIVKLTAAKLAFDSVLVAEVMTKPVITLAKSSLKDIFAALFLFRRYRIRHLPIVDQSNQLIGIMSPETIRQAMRPANLLKLRRVADVMSKNVIHALTTDTVLHLAQLMAQHRVSCVIITEADEQENILVPVGIITERDILQFQCLEAKLDNLEAGDVMSSPLFILSPEDSLLAAHQEMQRRHVRRLVVSWNWGQGLGIITQTSMLRIFDPMEMYSVIETLQSTVEQLEGEKAELLKLVNQIG